MAATESHDVVVVGGGGAGLTAALSAARLGRDVVLLEKASTLGGTTGLSVGTICVSSTPQQRAAGIDDSPDAHFEDMPKFAGPRAGRDNVALRRLYVDNVPEAFRFLMDLGIEFMRPIPEPPHRVPRLHAVVPHSRGYIYHLARHCRREGVRLRTGSPVSALTGDGARVTGVRLASGETIAARRAVVLASGDFSAAPTEFKRQYLGATVADIEGINPASTGDGQRMGVEAGGVVLNGDLAWGPELRFVAPPRPSAVTRIPPWRPFARGVAWAVDHLPRAVLRPFLMSFVTTFLAPSHGLFAAGAILVNAQGRRFCDERDHPEVPVSRQPDRVAYVVLDGNLARRFDAWPNYVSTAPGVGYAYLPDYARNRRDVCRRADDLRALAARIGVPADALTATVADCNTQRSGDDTPPPLTSPPFYALGPLKAWICFTEGGLKVSERLEVLREDGSPIAGLFAAGSAGQGGLLLEGHGHHIGWGVTSGRLAGRNAAFHPRVDAA
ncbi:MAG: FAD-dependent oxidoreductase [Ectothiorhodospiraceae bacterium]|nr:FAD-dependent oxidoreductase [Chromatiales bacterium]MCP5154663.1 FAD-dependent oxidoreductase [Ectothiorhodospiraceae bacterium]